MPIAYVNEMSFMTSCRRQYTLSLTILNFKTEALYRQNQMNYILLFKIVIIRILILYHDDNTLLTKWKARISALSRWYRIQVKMLNQTMAR